MVRTAEGAVATARAVKLGREPAEGQFLVLYDIEKNKVRNKVHEACRDYGLSPVQYSAFLGPLPRHKADELRERLARELGTERGTFFIVPVCEKDLAKVLHGGRPLGVAHVPVYYVV